MEKKFELTPEELEVVQNALEEALWVYKDAIRKWQARLEMSTHKFIVRKSEELLTRIKKYQDEQENKNRKS